MFIPFYPMKSQKKYFSCFMKTSTFSFHSTHLLKCKTIWLYQMSFNNSYFTSTHGTTTACYTYWHFQTCFSLKQIMEGINDAGRITTSIPVYWRRDFQRHSSVDQIELSKHQHYPVKKRNKDASYTISSQQTSSI